MIHNGDETGIDCGGNVCDACEVFAPEPEPGQVCDPNFGVNCQVRAHADVFPTTTDFHILHRMAD